MKEKRAEHILYRKRNLIILGILVVVFIAFLAMTSTLGVTASRMPRVVGVVGLILCAIEAYQQIKNYKSETIDKEECLPEVKGRPAWMILLMMVAYIPVMYILGFFIASLVFLFIVPYLLGRKKLLGNLIYSVVSTVLMWVCFMKVFSLRLPTGWLFDMIF